MKKLTLSATSSRSEIYIGRGLLTQTAARCLEVFSPSRIHIVTDSTVAPLYLDTVRAQFALPTSVTILPAGRNTNACPPSSKSIMICLRLA